MIEAVRFDQKRSRSSASAARCSRIITKYAARYPSENLQRVGTLRREPVQDGMPEHALGLSAFDLKHNPSKRAFATCLNKQAHSTGARIGTTLAIGSPWQRRNNAGPAPPSMELCHDLSTEELAFHFRDMPRNIEEPRACAALDAAHQVREERVKASFIIGRAVLAVLLMVGFYVLALGTAFGLLWVPYAELVYAHHITAKLAIICILGGATILWSVLPRWDKFIPPGPRLKQEKHPRLFQALEMVARATNQAMPREVYAVPDVNAWVTQRGGVMGFGSRRVMGLGLPLMRILTCSQFSAVLAHEFGHYHGGDTKIGPWIYKTRGAIGRTLHSLGSQSWLQAPFRWYGKMFLLVTHAVSRRQEFIADELAARTVGVKPLADGLRIVHQVAPAYDYYWRTECLPVFNAGFLPPLADGFGRFVTAEHIAERTQKHLEEQLAGSNKRDPYDTHPPLKDRIAAIAKLPEGPTEPQELPALSLLEDVPALERELLAQMAGSEAAQLSPIVWSQVGSRVYVPQWTRLVQLNADRLKGVMPESLDKIAGDLKAFGKTLLDLSRDPPDTESAAALGNAVVGAALALSLIQRGGELDFTPGNDFTVKLGRHEVNPFGVLLALKDGSMAAQDWAVRCVELGISGTELGAGIPAATDGAEEQLAR